MLYSARAEPWRLPAIEPLTPLTIPQRLSSACPARMFSACPTAEVAVISLRIAVFDGRPDPGESERIEEITDGARIDSGMHAA